VYAIGWSYVKESCGDAVKTLGFVIPTKPDENRRAILPEDLKNNVALKTRENIFVEEGYGASLDVPDSHYAAVTNVVTKEQAHLCDIVCDVKGPDESTYDLYKDDSIIFGWFHAAANQSLRSFLLRGSKTAIAWENMFNPDDSTPENYILKHNRYLSGRSGILHAEECMKLDYEGQSVAVLGFGGVGRGAVDALYRKGALVKLFGRQGIEKFQAELGQFDVVVNAVLWDATREDHLLFKKDLSRMKENAVIIDISCDEAGAIETTVPTTFKDPFYDVEGVSHYAVDNTPSFLGKEATDYISQQISGHLDDLVCDFNKNAVLRNAIIIQNGQILDRTVAAAAEIQECHI